MAANLFISALENDGEGAMADQVLGVVLEFANALHFLSDVTTNTQLLRKWPMLCQYFVLDLK